MSRANKPFFDCPERLPGFELPKIEHHLVYEWGTFQVSSEAYHSYGLVPLVARMQDGPLTTSEQPRSKLGLGVNIVLLGPSEAIAKLPVGEESVTSLTAASFVKNEDIGVVVSFGSATEEVLANQLNAIKTELRGDRPYDLEDNDLPLGPDGIPLTEMMANRIPQLYAHILAAVARDTVTSAAGELYRFEGVEAQRKLFARLGRTGLLAAGGVIGSTALLTGRVTGPSVILAGGYLVGSHVITNKKIKEYLREQPLYIAGELAKAEMIGEEVGDSLHLTYCSDHFDRTQQLDPDSPEDD